MEADGRLVIGPNASLDGRGALVFMAALGAAAFAICGASVYRGLWLVLPFAGLELAAVGLALWVCVRRNRYREVVEFRGSRVCIGFGVAGRGALSSVELPRAWTRVALEPAQLRNHPARLVLRCSGQRVELGRCLSDEDRERLADRIRALLAVPHCVRAEVEEGEMPDRMSLGDQ